MKPSLLLSVGLTALAFALGGCSSGPTIDMTKTGKGFFAATDADHVEILATLPKQNFTELATFSTAGWNPNNTAKMHNGIRQKAAGIGGDAVVIQNSGINTYRSSMGSRISTLWSTGVVLKKN